MSLETRILEALSKGYCFIRELVEQCYSCRSRLLLVLKRLEEEGKIARQRVHSGTRGRPRYKYLLVAS